ncbi:MAG TPA: serine/threonine-protein kinase [Thermoleophilaceae bacterium]|nr:serine/threonine-protein kinase [Thermoleophilaceae bacterium]
MTSPAGTLRYADRYRVLRRLGAGGMATVFLAEDERLGRQVAVKRLHADSPEDMAQRFDREARLGASLNHPNLVAVYDTLTDPEGVLIVMEYVDGPTLAQALRDGALEPQRALGMLRGVAAALDYAHAHGIVHRDVKPANVLLGEDGKAKLADLGIAFAVERATHITRTGTVLGTPSYMAPEQLEGRDVGPAVDVYALGAVAFEALSGRKARTGSSPVEIATRLATEPAPDLRETWPEAPAGAAQVLAAAMAADPAGRPRSAGELVHRLSAGLEGGGAPTEATRRAEPAAAPPAAGSAADRADGASDAAAPAPARPAPRAASPAPARGRRRTRPAWLAPVAVVLLLGLVAATAILASGGGEPASDGAGAGQTPGSEDERGAETSPGAAAGGGAAAPRQLSPAQTVTSFYKRAAADDYSGAWALAGPGFRKQIGTFDGFRQEQSTLESIDFEQAAVASQAADSAQVAIRTVATHTDGVDRCQGMLSLARGGQSGWLIDRAAITCPQSTRAGDGRGEDAGGGAAAAAGGAAAAGAAGGAGASGGGKGA